MRGEEEEAEQVYETDEPVQLTPDEEEELFEAVEQIRQGNFEDGQLFLEKLRSHFQS